MTIGTAILWLMALGFGLLAWYRKGGGALEHTGKAGSRFLQILPRIVVAILAAGFLAQLMPSNLVADHIGPDSGLLGTVLAVLVGGFIPAGPIVSFPLVVVLYEAGAGLPQLVALLTAWSVFAFHRVLIFETPMMGWRFSAVRLIASLPLPFVAAGITALLLAIIH
jgi:uncharacterized membrane protein YraQ (UPF0718 family)